MISGGVFLLEGSKKTAPMKFVLGVLGGLIRLFDIYQLFSGVHTIDVPVNIHLDGGGKPTCSPQHFQGKFVRGLLCCTILRQVSTEENNLAKK